MLDYAKLTGNFASVANGLNHNQQKNTSQLTHNQLNHSWRRMINAIDEHSSMKGFNYDEVWRDYAENFSLSPNPHQTNLHPLHNTIFANVRSSTLVVRQPCVLNTGHWYAWENNIVQPGITPNANQPQTAQQQALAHRAQTLQPQAAQSQAA